MEVRGLVEALAAGMRNLAGSFFEQQAARGKSQVEAPAGNLAGQTVIVPVGIEAEERQAKTVLATRGTMTAADVAAGVHEDGHHVELETDREIDFHVLDGDGHFYGMLGVGDDQLGGTIRQGNELVLLQLAQVRVDQLHGCLAGDVTSNAIRKGRLDNQRLPGSGGGQVNVRRKDLQKGPRRKRTTETQRTQREETQRKQEKRQNRFSAAAVT